MASDLFVSGIASGIDSAGLAKAVRDQATLPNVQREQKITALSKENSSLEQLNSLLLDVADSLDSSRSANGGAGASEAQSSNQDVLKVVADSSASFGSTDVTVESLARNASGSFDQSFSSESSFVSQESGTVSFSVGQGESASSFSVAVTPLTTAQEFVNQFNDNASGLASASLINIGTEANQDFRITFSTANAGLNEGALSVSASNEALLSDSGLSSANIEQATNARIKVSGISDSIERDSNVISDIVPGLTLELTGEGSASVNLSTSSSSLANTLESFVSSFNKLVEFVNKEDAVNPTEVKGERVNLKGSLADTDVDDRALSAIRSKVLGTTSDGGSLTLASFGLSTERDGTLSFDRETFESQVSSNPDAASELVTNLADSVSGVQGVVSAYTGYGREIDSAIEANQAEIESTNEDIQRLERTADTREDNLLKQFASLEQLIAQMNADAAVVASLLSNTGVNI